MREPTQLHHFSIDSNRRDRLLNFDVGPSNIKCRKTLLIFRRQFSPCQFEQKFVNLDVPPRRKYVSPPRV